MNRILRWSASGCSALAVSIGLVGSGAATLGGDADPAAVDERTGPGGEIMIVSRQGWRTDFARHTVPLIEFRKGGPGRDGIPALDDPNMTTVRVASRWLDDDEPVIEAVAGGEARAYPVQILAWHEIVNDTVGGVPVAVTYCPLCNSGLAFERRVGERTLTFGTTGNLRNNNLVMYDRETESWWQQLEGSALVGELAGTELPPLSAPLRSWSEFARDHPQGQVLSRATGEDRPYGSSPYVGLDEEARSATQCGYAAVLGSAQTCPTNSDDRLSGRERVVLVERGGETLAIPFEALSRERAISVSVGGDELEVTWSPGQRSAFRDRDGLAKEVGTAEVRSARTDARVPASTPFWFAVAASHPGIRVWTP